MIDISETTPSAPIIVLTIDGLNAFMLGLYGNTALETPAFDKIAADGIAFDFAFTHSTDLDVAILRMMTMPSGEPITDFVDGRTVCLTDCRATADAAKGAHFETIIDLHANANEADTCESTPAKTISETRTAEFFSAAIEAVEELGSGDLLWLHFSGLSQVWDAPLQTRFQFADEDDPEPYAKTAPPQESFDADVDDPDNMVSIQHSMTAQVAVIDQLLEVFLDFVDEHPTANKAHLIVSSPRGFSLGGGGKIGIGASLESESVHVPLLIRAPHSQALPTKKTPATTTAATEKPPFSLRGCRSHNLVQNSLIPSIVQHLVPETDSAATALSIETFLARHCSVIVPETEAPVFMSNQTQKSVQNHQWKLIMHDVPDQPPTTALYVKPDDRWDVNDVSGRCPRVVDDLLELLENGVAENMDAPTAD